jgi:SanA protein
MPKRRKFLIAVALLLLLAFAVAMLVRAAIHSYDHQIYQKIEAVNTNDWNEPRVAIVFGAAVYQDYLSTILEDRVKTAIALYKAGKVDRILVSGDNRTQNYNEPKAMAEYLATHAVDPKHIVVDYAGRSTYETCLRAHEIFGVKKAILITQGTHLPRALFLANKLGIEAYGVIADNQNYGKENSYQKLREIPAGMKAMLNVYLFPPATVLGEKLPIK